MTHSLGESSQELHPRAPFGLLHSLREGLGKKVGPAQPTKHTVMWEVSKTTETPTSQIKFSSLNLQQDKNEFGISIFAMRLFSTEKNDLLLFIFSIIHGFWRCFNYRFLKTDTSITYTRSTDHLYKNLHNSKIIASNSKAQMYQVLETPDVLL